MDTRTRQSKFTASDVKVGASTNTNARMAGQERRLQILREAMRLFSQRGFRGTTTKEIAQAAGVSEAMVFRHFATKEELYTAILDYKAYVTGTDHPEEFINEITAQKDDRFVFETIALKALDFHQSDPDFQRLLLHSALEGHQLARMFWERTVLQSYEVLGKYIRRRQLDGAFRNIDPKVVVRAFIGMLIHHSLNNNLWDREQSLLKISNEDAAREFTEILLRGIVVEQAGPHAVSAGRKRAARVSSGTTKPAKKSRKK
jgi:AcrR family transcriptional regulator